MPGPGAERGFPEGREKPRSHELGWTAGTDGCGKPEVPTAMRMRMEDKEGISQQSAAEGLLSG